MMNRVFLAFGIHNHQPVGNFDFIFEDSYQKAYKPFLDILEKHPRIKIGMHHSGILFEWLLANRPEYVRRIRALSGSGQVEPITGGYYEPILASIPETDRLGQIEKLNAFLRKHVGGEPSGMWCAERVWEPHLPQTMARAGVRYTLLDDSHFKYAGFEELELHGHFVTEELGDTVSLFPINERMRHAIPFQKPEAAIDVLRAAAEQGPDRLVVFADDGEKFGVWPGTHKHVYEDGWLEAFFRALDENSGWITLVHFREALDRIDPLGRVYLPTASYREMMHWTLRPAGYRAYEDFEAELKARGLYDAYHIFVRGGFWRNFLAKYPESNAMHKKMLAVSRAVWAAKKKMPPAAFARALDLLWAGQCNCPYWHGVFGGLYLPHLRHANFNRLIRAQAAAEAATRRGKEWVELHAADFDGDGREETSLSNARTTLWFGAPGGRLLEWDDKKHGVNLLNVMTRRDEGYHRTLREMGRRAAGPSDGVASIHDLVRSKEQGLDRALVRDRWVRNGFIDRFPAPGTTLEAFARSENEERGDFADGLYEKKWTKWPGGAEVVLGRAGSVRTERGLAPVRVTKRFSLAPGSARITVRYSVECGEALPGPLWFGVETAFAFTSPNDPKCRYTVNGAVSDPPQLGAAGEWNDVERFGLEDGWLGFAVHVAVDRPACVWRFPLETVSMSEAGFEKVYQGSVALVHWLIHPTPDEPFRVRFDLSVDALKPKRK
jgi:alpha-amylase